MPEQHDSAVTAHLPEETETPVIAVNHNPTPGAYIAALANRIMNEERD
jgi:hypothetical protein